MNKNIKNAFIESTAVDISTGGVALITCDDVEVFATRLIQDIMALYDNYTLVENAQEAVKEKYGVSTLRPTEAKLPVVEFEHNWYEP